MITDTIKHLKEFDIFLFQKEKCQKVIRVFQWIPTYQEFQEVFSNDQSLKILSILAMQTEPLCTLGIAKVLGVHSSTIKRYLEALHKYEFIEQKNKPNKPGKPKYYSITKRKIDINLDIDWISQSLQEKEDITSVPDFYLREKPKIKPRIQYILNEDGMIEEILIKKFTRAKRYVKQRIVLSKDESQFLKYLPHPTKEAKLFQDICKQANFTHLFAQKSLLPFVQKLKQIGMIEYHSKT